MRVMIQEQDYDLGAPWPDTLIHHRADCPARDGRPCICGPLGYRAIVDGMNGGPPICLLYTSDAADE